MLSEEEFNIEKKKLLNSL
ncbi:MAG: hypothetical protein ACOC34_06880 [Thermotogota bacterium]